MRRDSKRLKMGGILSTQIWPYENMVNNAENDGAGVSAEQHTDDSDGKGDDDGETAASDAAAPDDESLLEVVAAGGHSDDSESPDEVALDATKQQTPKVDKGKGAASTDPPTAASPTTPEPAPTATTEDPPAPAPLRESHPVYRITYHSALPWSNTASGTGFTDDPALVALARSLSLSPYFKRPYKKSWVVAILPKQDARVFTINGGVVELKSGNRATVNMYNAVMETRDWLVEKEGWKMDGEKGVEGGVKEEVKRMWAKRAKGVKKGKGVFRLGQGLPGVEEKEVDDEEKEKEKEDVTKTDQEGREETSELGSMSAGKDDQNDQKQEKKVAQGDMKGKAKAKAEGQADWDLLQKLHKEKMERVVKQQEEILKSVKGG